MHSLKKKAIFGLSWTMLEYGFMLTFQLSQLMVLARILTPEDFGVFAIGTFFSTLGNGVFALGMGTAIIQKSGNVMDYLNTAWSANLLISFIAFILLMLVIPFVVTYYFENTSAIAPSLLLSSVVFISGLNNIGIVLYMKNIQLKKVFFYNVVPKGIGVILSIVISVLLKSYWGLVIGMVSESVFRALISYRLSPVRPKFSIEKKKFYELYSFGGWLQLKNVVTWLVNNFDTFIVGSVTSVSLLGFYNRAITVARLPQNQIKKVVNAVFFPLYSSFQNDKDKLQAGANAVNDLVLLFIIPIVLVSQYFGDMIVQIVLGDGWLEMTSTFQLLIIAVSVEAYLISYVPLIRAKGYSKVEFYFYLFKVVFLLIGLYPLTLHYGIKGAASAILVANGLASPYVIWKVFKIGSVSFKSIITSIVVGAIAMLVVFLFMLIVGNNLEGGIWISILLSVAVITLFIFTLWLVYWILRIGPFKTVIKAYKAIKVS